MCGIIGTLNLCPNPPINPDHLRGMLGAVRHRGPDEFGLYLFQDAHSGVGLGNARLSIIDLDGGQQPLCNEDGSIWIVFNGEIYNYVELRPHLQQIGHTLQTNSDTEVIIHLYETYGPDCVNYLNGQFAFAIWDEHQRTLLLARDRVGIRPLYYTIQNGALLFASEIKSLLVDPRVTPQLDPFTLDQIFTFWSPIQPRTIFKNIYTLPPGHLMQVGPDGNVDIDAYWQPTFSEEAAQKQFMADHSLDEAADELRERLVDATKIRLRADVPVGAYLSGGLDSSATAALVHHYTDNRLETFSIAFADEVFDESEYQQEMVHRLGTHHHQITCTSEDVGRTFPEVIWHSETPLMRTAPAPLFLLSKLVHDLGFKVVLTGEGADEFLGGYNIFKEAKIRRFWARDPESAWRPSLLTKLYPYIGELRQGNDAYLQKFFGQGLANVAAYDYSHTIRWRNTSRSKRFFAPELYAQIPEQSPVDQLEWPDDFDSWSSLAQAQYLEITVFMAEYLLSSQGDRMGMAHSVEGRFPFLDHRLIEFAAQLPPHYKIRGLDEKHILKRAMRDLLPEAIWNRPKRPYRAPIHNSFFPGGQPLDWVSELLSPEKVAAAGYFNPLAISQLIKKIERFGRLGETDNMALAGLLSTHLIHRQFITDFQPARPISNLHDNVKIIDKRVIGILMTDDG
ncbi:MAG: asparagine synthase (glutamine-hydrolyzing) [Chloroflexi bacterium]|nr:asparagine synthase (glutamine-hydrolyzing) [Chloroflexota bacterium]